MAFQLGSSQSRLLAPPTAIGAGSFVWRGGTQTLRQQSKTQTQAGSQHRIRHLQLNWRAWPERRLFRRLEGGRLIIWGPGEGASRLWGWALWADS